MEVPLNWFGPMLRCAVVFFAPVAHLSAVIFYGTSDADHNTSAPAGELAGSGWQYQGRWGAFLGTPIAPRYFVSAEHLGGQVGDTFVYEGTSHTTTAVYDDPNSDLRIWKINGTFSTYAPLYTGSDEAGKLIVVFGRGTQRGNEIRVDGSPRGWEWGASDGVLRWGTNVATGIYDGKSLYGASLIGAEFNSDAGGDEVTLSSGDSGGGAFIQEGGVWKFAGINSWVDGPYNTVASSAGAFTAALFNADGYYYDSLTSGGQVTDPASGPGLFFLTRISSRMSWIQSVTGASYADWSGGDPATADANHDGVPNLLAYAIGALTPASDARSKLPRIAPDGSFTLDDSSKSDILYEIQISEDLATWYSVAVKPKAGNFAPNPSSGYPHQANITQSGTTAISVRDSTSVTRRFWRLKVGQ